jgi:hypothetical protein
LDLVRILLSKMQRMLKIWIFNLFLWQVMFLLPAFINFLVVDLFFSCRFIFILEN